MLARRRGPFGPAAAALLLKFFRKFARAGRPLARARAPCHCGCRATGFLAEGGARRPVWVSGRGPLCGLCPSRRRVVFRVTPVATVARLPAGSSASRVQNQAYQPPSATLSCAIFLDKARCMTRRDTSRTLKLPSIRPKTSRGPTTRGRVGGGHPPACKAPPPRPVAGQPCRVGRGTASAHLPRGRLKRTPLARFFLEIFSSGLRSTVCAHAKLQSPRDVIIMLPQQWLCELKTKWPSEPHPKGP
jgi:hypothetical protein